MAETASLKYFTSTAARYRDELNGKYAPDTLTEARDLLIAGCEELLETIKYKINIPLCNRIECGNDGLTLQVTIDKIREIVFTVTNKDTIAVNASEYQKALDLFLIVTNTVISFVEMSKDISKYEEFKASMASVVYDDRKSTSCIKANVLPVITDYLNAIDVLATVWHVICPEGMAFVVTEATLNNYLPLNREAVKALYDFCIALSAMYDEYVAKCQDEATITEANVDQLLDKVRALEIPEPEESEEGSSFSCSTK